MRRQARSLTSISILTVFLISSLSGCYNSVAVAPPTPADPAALELDRVVLNSGEIIRLDSGEFELRDEELAVWDQGPAIDVRVIPRTEIARFETRQLSTGRTVGAVILVPVGIWAAYVAYLLISGCPSCR